jgi:hypothetical protein
MATQVVVALTRRERRDFEECEEAIRHGLSTFVDVGKALAKVKRGLLYRETHETFESYCRDRWGMGRNYVNKQIAAARAVENVGTIVPILPTTESQARPLTALPAAKQRKAWEQVIETAPKEGEGGKPVVTAKLVSRVVRQITGANGKKPQIKGSRKEVGEAVDLLREAQRALRRILELKRPNLGMLSLVQDEIVKTQRLLNRAAKQLGGSIDVRVAERLD